MRNILSGGIRYALLALVLLTAFGAGLRLYRLGEMDTRGDEVFLLVPPMKDSSPIANFLFDWKGFKEGRTMCLPRMTASAVFKGLHLPSTRFHLRLTYCVMGILTIPALYLLGLRLGDRRLAWILAFLGCVNPYLVVYSRYAHVYAFPLLFNALSAAFACGMILGLRRGERARAGEMAWFCAAAILACHSHMSSWPLVGLLWGLLFLTLWLERATAAARASIRGVGLAFAVWLAALLPWILVFVSALFTARESFLQGGYGAHAFAMMWRLPFVMTWGGGMPWIVLTVFLLLTGMLGGLASPRWRPIVAVALAMGVAMFGAMSLMMHMGGQFFNLRYYTPLWLVFNLLGGLGMLLASEWVAARLKKAGGPPWPAGYVAAGGCGIVAACMIVPLGWIIHLPGNPTPYTMINRWMDEHLPRNTPVIVDRWLEPWNEMLYHAPSNVVATFTVPAEPAELFLKYNWRETVRQFFAKYPDAAYLELTKAFWENPAIGPWDWPRRHFARHVAFTNEQAMALRRAMLIPDEGYYTPTMGRMIVDLYYNTRDDAVSQARAAGSETLVLYGPEWGYAKPWQQLQDFRDWRTLEAKAVVEVYNFTPRSGPATLCIRGMAVNGSKRVSLDGVGQADFQHLKLAEWRIERVPLRPGLNRFTLSDPLWSVARIPLLVDQVSVSFSDEAAPGGDRPDPPAGAEH